MNIVIFAAKDPRLVAGILVASALALIAIFLIASAMSSRRRKSEIPWAIRPGPSDDELESKTLPRFLAVGSIFLLFLSVWLPGLWLREPTRIDLKEEQFLRESIHRGEILYAEHAPEGTRGAHFSANCARCHGPEGEGALQPFKEKFDYAEPPLKYIVSRYKAAGNNDEEIRQIIVDAIERGRPGTLMPTWGQSFGGPLNQQQIDDVVNFIYAIQEPIPGAGDVPVTADSGAQLFDANCAVCHTHKDPETGEIVWGGVGPDLRGVVAQLGVQGVRDTIHDGRINYNRPSMPTWAFLGDSAIDALVAFLQSLQTAR
ncbi:MAG TPA: c-type cytochrome [Actinomycetota bacterium]|nr:c-type cytochrome [Actinomycetota bacterium]